MVSRSEAFVLSGATGDLAADIGLTSPQLEDTARWVVDPYPGLLTSAESDPTPLSNDEDEELVVGKLAVRSRRRVGRSFLWRLPVVLGHPVATIVYTTGALVALPGRVVELMTLAEQTLTATRAAVVRTNALLDRVEGSIHKSDRVTQAADRAVTAAAGTLEQVRTLTSNAARLLEDYSEPLHRLAPRVRRLAETTQPAEVEALVTLLDRQPQLADAIDHKVIPLLDHLSQRSPDIDRLLDTVSHLSHMISRLPKLSRQPIPSGTQSGRGLR